MTWRSSSIVALLVVASCADSPEDAASTDEHTTAVVRAGATPKTEPASTSTASSDTAASTPATSTSSRTAAPTTTAAGGVAPEGFDVVAGRITAANGETCDVCLWVAATPESRAQGLMGVTDLSGADGMLFRWDEPTTGAFWMRDTLLPLSIAFFAGDGSFVSAADMTPCLDPVPDAECARYAAAGPYTDAIEVAAGGLPDLLIGPGSRVDVFDEPCPLATG